MTERERSTRGPTNQKILEAVESLGLAYHQFASALQAREEDDRRERRYIRERLDSLFGALDALQTKVDRQLDQVWKELDDLKADVEALKAGRP